MTTPTRPIYAASDPGITPRAMLAHGQYPPFRLEVPARYVPLARDASRVVAIQLCVQVLAAASGAATDLPGFLATLLFILVGVVVYHLVVESLVDFDAGVRRNAADRFRKVV